MADNRSASEKYTNIANPADYAAVDPTGQNAGAYDAASNMSNYARQGMSQTGGPYDPNAYLSQYFNNVGGMTGSISGAASPVEAMLSGLAQRQSGLAGNAVANEFAGRNALHSGAASAAMGQAMADPFAQVAGNLGQQQLGLTGNMLNSLLGQASSQYGLQGQLRNQQFGQYAGLAGQGLGNMTSLANNMSGTMAPQYEYNKTPFESFMGNFNNAASGIGGAASAAGSVKALFGCLHPNFKVELANGKHKKVKRIKPGDIVLGRNRKPEHVVIVQKSHEVKTSRFVQLVFNGSRKLVTSARHIIDREQAQHFVVGQSCRGGQVQSFEWVDAPKVSYDIMTDSGVYYSQGIEVKSMIGELGAAIKEVV